MIPPEFVAGANQGSPLAREANWKKLVEVFSYLGSIPGAAPWVGISVDILVGFLKIAAHAIARLPSVAALAEDPGNEFIELLNARPHTRVDEYATLRANYRPRSPNWFDLVAPGIDLLFERKANDMVVPFDEARRFDPYVEEDTFIDSAYGSDAEGQSAIWHTNFFPQKIVRESLLRALGLAVPA